MSPLGAIVAEEAVVDASSALAEADSFTIISFSSASPADSDLNSSTVMPPPPVNTPAKSIIASPGASQPNSQGNIASLDQLFSCFYPFNRIWPFSWSGAQKEDFAGSDSEAENYEITLESIDVNFKENYIGGGNQSSVFRGKWRDQWIALKKLNRASEVDIKRLCSLDHPNVIKTLGVSTKDIYPCIVMEYCEKGGLFDYLRRTPVLSKALFLRWSVEVASGMAYLHSLKILHRDLKSPNILVDNQDTLKICDFGSLYTWDQRLNSQNQAPTHMASVVMSVCGTSQWMSPEMMKNEPCNEKVDVWSYGVVLWELLTGEVPFEKIAPMAVCFGVGSDRLRLHVPRTAPGSVKLLFKLCWAKKPRNRASFETILKSLNNLQAELGEMQEAGWTMRRELWRREIAEENVRLMLHNSGTAGEMDAKKQKEEELVQKRMHELRHAQEIRQMYEEKLKKVDRCLRKINRFMQQMEQQKMKNEAASAELEDRSAHNAHWHQLLLEWHAALVEAGASNHRMDLDELNYRVRQAEEARKTAKYLESGKRGIEQGKEAMEPQGNRTSASGRPAILRMTYYDYDKRGQQIGMEQRVLAAEKTPVTAGSNFGERKPVTKTWTAPPGQASPFVKCRELPVPATRSFCRPRRRNTSTSGSSEDEAEEEEQYFTPVGRREQPQQRKRLRSATNGNQRPQPLQQQHSLMSSCPSECSSLANMPSSCSDLFSRTSSYRHSMDPQSPSPASMQKANTPKSFGTPSQISREDSAISSAVPFSPSERSLQNMANNNPSAPHPHAMLCLQCQSNLALPLSVQQQFFARNSVARVSGLSADSGVCHEEEAAMPILHSLVPLSGVLEEENGNNLATATCCLAPNSCQCRQTDEVGSKKSLPKGRRSPRRSASQIPFARNSPFRTPSRRTDFATGKKGRSKTQEQRRAKTQWPRLVLTEDVLIGPQAQFSPHAHSPQHSHCSTSSSATLGRTPSHVEALKNRRLTELREQSSQEQDCPPSQWFSSPELCQTGREDSTEESSPREESPREDEEEMPTRQPTLRLGPIDEMTDSQLTERAMAAEKTMAAVMMESSSTMVSSLERSLEMAVANSDGLSDREARLKEARTTFKLTHRRTASNPTIVARVQQQKSMDGSTTSSSAHNNNGSGTRQLHSRERGEGGGGGSSSGTDSEESPEEGRRRDN